MMTEKTVDSPEKFYDSEYWKQSSGQFLWNMRKMLAFIMEISNPETPAPFLTVLHGDEAGSMEKWEGWFANWGGEIGQGDLNLEWNKSNFLVYSFDKSSEYEFWYEFDATEPESWVNFDEAIDKSKDWLVRNKNMLTDKKKDSLRSVFNLS
jgi:hypothetical protein